METRRYTIDELTEKTGFTRRTIRFYVQEGLIEPPAGRGRGGFYYDSQLAKLQQIKAYQEKGLRLSDIQRVLQAGGASAKVEVQPAMEVWVRYPLGEGVEIHASRSLDEKKRKRVEEIVRLARSILTGGDGDE